MSGAIRIGLISDTHGLLRPDVHQALAGVSQILHAGDVCSPTLLDELATIAPVQAVFGNCDDPWTPGLSASLDLVIGGLRIHVQHGHELGRPGPEAVAAAYDADICVYGHTHRQLITQVDGRLIVNPGAAGPRRFDLEPSVAILTIAEGRAHAELVSLAEGPSVSVAAVAPPADRAPRTVLLADDEASVRLVTKRLLERQGWTVLDTVDGQDAWDTFRERQGDIDLLVTDVRMPRLDGINLVRLVRESQPACPVLVISGYDRIAGDTAASLERVAFIPKPFTATVLSDAVQQAFTVMQG